MLSWWIKEGVSFIIAVLFSISGIVIVCIGSIVSVWSVITTNEKLVGTYDELAKRHELFIEQKKQVKKGLILIGLGSALQIVGLIL